MSKCIQDRYQDVDYVLVAEEKHQDGQPHLHAVVCFSKEKNFRSDKCFDFDGYHANVQACKNLEGSYIYVMKDGEWMQTGSMPQRIKNLLKNKGQGAKNFYEEMVKCESESSLLKFCIDNRIAPGYYYEVKKQFEPDIFTINEDTEGDVADAFMWCEYTEKTMILWGKSGIGKTTWAIRNMPKPILLVTHLDELKKYNPKKHKSILFDDMDFKHLPLQTQIHLVDQDIPRSIHVRYGVARIPARVPKVFTCNDYPFVREPPIERRTVSNHFNMYGEHRINS